MGRGHGKRLQEINALFYVFKLKRSDFFFNFLFDSSLCCLEDIAKQVVVSLCHIRQRKAEFEAIIFFQMGVINKRPKGPFQTSLIWPEIDVSNNH